MTTARLLVLGAWVCGVTLLSGHLALTWRAETPPAAEAPFFEGLEYEETALIHVPIIAHGEVQGYVAAQFVFTADARTLRQMTVKPHPYVRDEALRAIYSNGKVDFSRLERVDIDALLKTVKTGVNARLGGELVKDVLVKEFNYVRKDQLRG
ncbi:MAG: hypothetical protein Q8R85_05025 [Bosea sp. (in: a-proteobacteria)]|jgi:hypothetical protein|uniref:hypothetical protein n=1 Tax=Bosea sp. (in: a-proteobacteria) TaxID=1871050 RepID=UPI001D7D34E9|nr:hypothetical protein [Bosea sp. (in: a-proteobacteria)]MBX9873269.1 hypothetical protein [Beijerinckiaceae bacterium]MDP3600514.1 hypothetical protein [Bosea sp. (in: a-proteobacteria)]WRH56632.1 MAG: hypothetical protein RSE11_16510 [Bosea sp. (in: a-proteobacteria)]